MATPTSEQMLQGLDSFSMFLHSQLSVEKTAGYNAAMDAVVGLSDRGHDLMDIKVSGAQPEPDKSLLLDKFFSTLAQNVLPLEVDTLISSFQTLPLSPPLNARDSVGRGNCVLVDLVNPDALRELEEMASLLTEAGYRDECHRAYCRLLIDAFNQCLSFDESHDINGNNITNWIQALKIAARVVIPSERRLCDKIFSLSQVPKEGSFVGPSEHCMMNLLTFCETVANASLSSEKLFRVLDMYDALAESLSYLKHGEPISTEARRVLATLGESAKAILAEFEKAVKGEASRKEVQGGDIHPMTRYVMNYIKLLLDSGHSLNSFLKIHEVDQSDPLCGSQLDSMTPLACNLRVLISSLEHNLVEKSNVYDHGPLRYIFLMNNGLYILHKVKSSELMKVMGDIWVRKQHGQISRYATSYLRASWGKALSYMNGEGIQVGKTESKAVIKERLKKFNACLEDVYRQQTGWKVPDRQLREELQISVSKLVVPAYRSFVVRYGSQVQKVKHGGKYIKYAPEDLEKYLLDLLEGFHRVLHHFKR